MGGDLEKSLAEVGGGNLDPLGREPTPAMTSPPPRSGIHCHQRTLQKPRRWTALRPLWGLAGVEGPSSVALLAPPCSRSFLLCHPCSLSVGAGKAQKWGRTEWQPNTRAGVWLPHRVGVVFPKDHRLGMLDDEVFFSAEGRIVPKVLPTKKMCITRDDLKEFTLIALFILLFDILCIFFALPLPL